VEQGVEAFANEDVSNVFAGLCGIEKQQVWVDRADLARAKSLLAQHDHPAVASAASSSVRQQPMMDVTCEECGQVSQFSIDLLGSIQDCQHCGAYVDVGEVDETGAWDEGEEEDFDADEDE
jgi:hypothetical protein